MVRIRIKLPECWHLEMEFSVLIAASTGEFLLHLIGDRKHRGLPAQGNF